METCFRYRCIFEWMRMMARARARAKARARRWVRTRYRVYGASWHLNVQ